MITLTWVNDDNKIIITWLTFCRKVYYANNSKVAKFGKILLNLKFDEPKIKKKIDSINSISWNNWYALNQIHFMEKSCETSILIHLIYGILMTSEIKLQLSLSHVEWEWNLTNLIDYLLKIFVKLKKFV